METKNKLVFTPQGNYLLTKGNRPCDCPFQPAVVVPSQMGSLSITRVACSSDCALMKIQFSETKKTAIVEMKCAKDFIIVNVEVEETTPQKPSLTLLK